nr:unnamed protein product [Callosobruchus analis]
MQPDEVFEAEIAEMKKENMMHHYVHCTQLTEESNSKINSTSPKCESILHRVKSEPTVDYGNEDYLTLDTGKVKMENQLLYEIKGEKLDGMKYEDQVASQLNTELEIKCETDTHTMSDPLSDSAAKKNKGGKGPQVDGTEAGRALFICYNCNFTAGTKKRLILHIVVGICNQKAKSIKSRLAYTRRNPSNDYVCTQCNIVFTRKPNLDGHIIKMHRASMGSVSSKIHGCTHCDYKNY